MGLFRAQQLTAFAAPELSAIEAPPHADVVDLRIAVAITGVRTFALGAIADHDTIDEVLAIHMPAPHSYTRQDVVEIQAHGGILPIRHILQLVLAAGARPAEPGEMTLRAFVNGRLDLAQAEAVLDEYMEILARIHSLDTAPYEALGMEKPEGDTALGLADRLEVAEEAELQDVNEWALAATDWEPAEEIDVEYELGRPMPTIAEMPVVDYESQSNRAEWQRG